MLHFKLGVFCAQESSITEAVEKQLNASEMTGAALAAVATTTTTATTIITALITTTTTAAASLTTTTTIPNVINTQTTTTSSTTTTATTILSTIITTTNNNINNNLATTTTTIANNLTPKMTKKCGLSAININDQCNADIVGGVIVGPMTESGFNATKLSTFSSQGKGNVQLRRTTNKHGKQAPAPPKRTSLLSMSRDSTYHEDDGPSRHYIDEHISNDLTRDVSGNLLQQRNESENDKSADGLSDATVESVEQQQPARGKYSHSMHTSTHSTHNNGNNNINTNNNNGFRHHHSSFKRPTNSSLLTCRNAAAAAAIATAAIETRQSKRNNNSTSQHQQQQKNETILPLCSMVDLSEGRSMPPITVGALEVLNVKRVVNRYGTLPKVARIGAFLDSLETGGNVDDATSTSVQNDKQQHMSAQHKVGTSSLSSASMPPPPPPQQMIRSNSSSGVTMLNNATAANHNYHQQQQQQQQQQHQHHHHNHSHAKSNQSGSQQQQQHNKLQRHRTTTDCSMVTFSSFRGSSANHAHSPKRIQLPPPNLLAAEFLPPPPPPPPTLDLPPPPIVDMNAVKNSTTTLASPPPPTVEVAEAAVAALTAKAMSTVVQPAPPKPPPPPATINATTIVAQNFLHDVSNTAPSVEEASTRFGVSLRRRDASAESCQSMGNSPAEMVNTTMTNGNKLGVMANSNNGDTVTSLVNELTETLNIQQQQQQVKTNNNNNVGGFKTQLKKIETKKQTFNGQKKVDGGMGGMGGIGDEDAKVSIINFKAHLRKVDNNDAIKTTTTMDTQRKLSSMVSTDVTTTTSTSTTTTTTSNALTPTTNKTENCLTNNDKIIATTTMSSANTKNQNNGNNVKLNSTMQQYQQQQQQQSDNKCDNEHYNNHNNNNNHHENGLHQSEADIGVGGIGGFVGMGKNMHNYNNNKEELTKDLSITTLMIAAGNTTTTTSPSISPTITTTTTATGTLKSKYQQNCELAAQNSIGKPAVPLKPTKLAIYATPSAQQQQQQPQQTTKSNNLVNTINSPAGGAQLSCISRENILEWVSLLESAMKQSGGNNQMSGTQWCLQLCDKLQILHNSCVIYADNEAMPPHSKFHFRELVTRIDSQSQSLRTAGNKSAQEYERLTGEVAQTLRQIHNVLSR